MTIVLRHCEALELNLVEYRDAISLAQLHGLAAFVAEHPEHMKHDSLALFAPGSHFSDVKVGQLAELFDHYRKLYAPLHFETLRRSAYVCQSPAVAAHLGFWLSGDIRKAMSSTVRQFGTIAEAGAWLVLSAEQISLIERREGSIEIMRFGDTPAPAR